MDYKKSKAPVNTVTRDLASLWEETGNIYESVSIIAKRANQIGQEIKQDLNKSPLNIKVLQAAIKSKGQSN